LPLTVELADDVELGPPEVHGPPAPTATTQARLKARRLEPRPVHADAAHRFARAIGPPVRELDRSPALHDTVVERSTDEFTKQIRARWRGGRDVDDRVFASAQGGVGNRDRGTEALGARDVGDRAREGRHPNTFDEDGLRGNTGGVANHARV